MIGNRTSRFSLLGSRWFLVLLATGLLYILACGRAASKPIVVFGAPDSPRLRQVVAGLKAGLAPRSLEVVAVPAHGAALELELRRVRGLKPPLLIVLGTPALMAVAPVEKKIPVIFAMVADPYFSGAAYDAQRPDFHQINITGIASPPPVDAALSQGAKLFGPRPWGLIYDPLDGASLEIKELFTSMALRHDLTPLTTPASSPAEDQRALETFVAQGTKVIYLPPTETARRLAPLLLAAGRERKIMVVNGHPEIDPRGAILSVTLDYEALGREAAALAKRVLAGEKPARIPIAEAAPLKITADDALLAHWSGYPPPGGASRGR